MATTQDIELDAGVWTKIATPTQGGFVTNESGVPIRVREDLDATPPSVDFGHTIYRGNDPGFFFELAAGQAIYARPSSDNPKGQVAVTVNG